MGESSTSPQIIVLDGHDGSGKTTLARLAAETLGGTYVKPFDGTLGDMIMWLSDERRYELADQLARASMGVNGELAGSASPRVLCGTALDV